MAKITEFFDISIDGVRYEGAKGVMYAKPTPETVLASLHIPVNAKESNLWQEKWVTLSAMCEGFRPIDGIKAWVDHWVQLPGTGKFYTLIIYRKGKEPPESFETS